MQTRCGVAFVAPGGHQRREFRRRDSLRRELQHDALLSLRDRRAGKAAQPAQPASSLPIETGFLARPRAATRIEQLPSGKTSGQDKGSNK